MGLFLLAESLEMFSLEHIIAVLVTLSIILLFFFLRKLFIGNKKADMSFRIILGLLLIYSEFQIRFDSCFGKSPIVFRNIPLPLCGMLLWIASIGLLSNSKRIMRAFYPVFLTGATLSMIMCSIGGANFPDFRAFQYFICHGGFLLGALYFVFTKKIKVFTFKDYGYSCLALGSMAAVMAFLYATNPHVFPDDFYMMGTGLPEFKPVYEACGQIGYSLIYMSAIALIMLVFTVITWLLTRHRENDNEFKASFNDNKALNYLSGLKSKNRGIIITASIIVFMYMISWQAIIGNMSLDGKTDPIKNQDPGIIAFGWIIGVLWFLIIFMAVLNEVIYYYKKERNLED